MNLADELFALTKQRSAGRIGPVEYYQALIELIDASPDVAPDPAEILSAFVRRAEALLEDRLGASGGDLYWKIESTADRIPPDLQSELRSLAKLTSLAQNEIGTIQSRCDRALLRVAHLVETLSPPDPGIRNKAFLPVWTTLGLVRTVRCSQRPIRPGGRVVQRYALADIDGRIVVISSVLPLQIEKGDRVAIAGFADHEASLHFNESRPSGAPGSQHERTARVLGGLGVTSIVGGAAMVCLALNWAIHSYWKASTLGWCAALIAGGALTSCVGLWLAVAMRQSALAARALDRALASSPKP